MQPLLGAPRAALTEAQVRGLLGGYAAVQTRAGLELLNADLTLAADISDDLAGGSVEWVAGATIHRTCKLAVSQLLAWGTALVRPYLVLSAEGVEARWNVGVFALATPARVLGASPDTYDVTGYDRLYLLLREVGDTYTVAAGVGYLAAVRAAVTAAGLSGVQLDGSAEAKTLPTAATWPLSGDGDSGTTWLGIINDLLGAIGYRGLYADENGVFRSEPYANPVARASEWTFPASGDASTVGDERTETADLWQLPNRWVFVQQNIAAEPVAGAGRYQYDLPATDPMSAARRGLVWTRTVKLDVADQASLVVRGDIIVAADRRVSRTFQLATVPFPAAGHADVFTYDDPLVGAVKVTARRWELDLGGADTKWTWEVAA